MRLKVLGSAAGGGFPQWNCGCHNCSRLRDGSFRGRARTQIQVAVSANPEYTLREHWSLLDASPDLRSQILGTPDLAPYPRTATSSPIFDVYLTSADVDSLMGLLHLREFQPFKIYALPSIKRIIEENAMFRVLGRAHPPVQWFPLPLATQLNWEKRDNPKDVPQFVVKAVSLGDDYPDYIGEKLRRDLPPAEAVAGLAFEYQGKRGFFAPVLRARDGEWKKWVESSDLVLIDGTFWADDELIRIGRSGKTARQIGHLPLSGNGGLLEQYPKNANGRKILIHINNTNPILDEDSAEHRAVLDAGFEIAYDGMEITL